MEELQNQINFLKNELEDLRYILSRKTGLGPADIKGKIVAPSNVGTVVIENSSITNAKMADDSIKQAELDTETVAVTVTAGGATGTATVTSGSIVLGWRPTGNNDQFVDNISISGTTLTITLAANAVADNLFSIILLKS